VGLHDLLGRTIATLLDDRLPAGEHRVQLDADGIACRAYLLVLSAGESRTSRMVWLSNR
jgi:hypothetical protein